MKPKTKRFQIIYCLLAVIISCLLVVFSGDIFGIKPSSLEKPLDYFKHKLIVSSVNHYRMMPRNIDTVEIFTLSDEADAKDTNGFFGDLTNPIKTLDHKTVTGETATEIAGLWGNFQMDPPYQAMCFEPVYGLQFKRHGKIYFQKAICWHCSAFTVLVPLMGNVEYGFDSDSIGAQKLLKAIEQQLPLPPQPLETNAPAAGQK